ncbi:hypothetical protein BKA64DRAFT_373294 [Cadophora sp. MPI-SDFR-AT-0126]|nr:hypothetical protein BKA64DRAFT_373294 [Leotiomycetes sp. MPI-SDFR-AT-0126]
MDLDEFESLALQSPRINDEMALVVGHLMARVRKELERPFVHGRYMLPDVLRCDGINTEDSEKEDISATWVCIPYFSMENPNTARADTSRSSSHPLRTLLQSCYDFESTIDREFNHQSHIGESHWEHKVVSLPQVWCLILGTDTIISSAHKGLDILSKPVISRTIFTGDSDKASLVKIIDPYKRQFFFPLKSCRTFYELKTLVVEQCLDDISLSIEDYDLVHNHSILASHNWMDVVRSTRSLILVVSLVDTKREGSSDPSMALAHRYDHRKPQNARVDDDGSDSSHSSSDDGNEIALAQASMKPTEATESRDPRSNALILMSHHRPFPIRSSSRERIQERRRNFEKVHELQKTGLIINEPDSITPKKKIKMYSLQPEAKASGQPQVQSSFRDDASKVPERSANQAFVTDHEDEKSLRQSQTLGNSSTRGQNLPESKPKTPKLALRVPPFFAWSLDQSSTKSGKAKTAGNVSKSRALKSILSGVEQKILVRDLDLKRTYEQFLEVRTSIDRSSIYTGTPSIDLDDLERLKKPLNGDLQDLRQQLAIIESGGPRENTAPTSSKAAFILNPHSEKDDPFVLKQMIALQTELRSLINHVEDLVECFVPRSYDHQLMKKVWGALGTLITVISEAPDSEGLSKSASQPKTTPSSSRSTRKEAWTIRYFAEEDTAAVVLRNGKKLLPSRYTLDCQECANIRSPTLYNSEADAISHLNEDHYGAHDLTPAEQASLSILVLNGDQSSVDKWRKDMLTIVQTFAVHLQSITASTKEMLEAVAEANEESLDAEFNYTLPRTVVRTFQNNIILLTTASYSIRQLRDRFRLRNTTSQEETDANFNSLLSFLGVRAEISMTTAIKDLILMVRTGETSESVNYAAIGPRYIMIVLFKNLLTKKLTDNTGLVEFYKQRTLKLQYDVYHKPARRRILGDIQLLNEELSAVLATRKAQVNAICHFGWVGNAKTYRISNQSRNQQYHLEGEVGQGCIDQLHNEINDLDLLLDRLVTLEQKVRYRVEVLEEDNSKAIFIFTVVAAVFLPLSFVTSYLGMNTIDIRDMNRSQSIFWATAVPATFAVVALAILAAYRDAVREWAREKRHKLRQPTLPRSKARTKGDPEGKIQGTKKRARMGNNQVDLV